MLPTGISYLKNYVLKSVKVPVFTQKHRAKLASAWQVMDALPEPMIWIT